MSQTVISVATVGVQVLTSNSSQTITIPNSADGKMARKVRLQSTGFCYVRPIGSSGVATVHDILLSPNASIILSVLGFGQIAYLQESSSVKLNITPLEN